MAKDTASRILIDIELNSQMDQFEDERTEIEKKLAKQRLEYLKSQGLSEEAAMRQRLKEEQEIKEQQERDYENDIRARLKDRMEYGATVEERKQAENDLKRLDRYEKAGDLISKKISSALSSGFDNIKQAAYDYADYVERLEVGLIGSTKSYDTVSEKLNKVFSMNVFFNLKDALDKTTEMVESGINYNVELRASLDTMADKIVKTFEATNETLLRLVKIQQADSTQARLGVESYLQEYLNKNFQNSEYLHGLSDQVSAVLLEMESKSSKEEATEIEYAVQKWLGSFSSVGVSDNTILALAKGLGYLGSGDVQSLVSDNSLQSLIALSAQRGGGSKSYGEMLTGGIDVADVSTIFKGFYDLVSEIKDSGNQVAINQYAKLFGLSMSDIVSTLNLTTESIENISKEMISYKDAVGRVESELSSSKLMARTSASEIFNNIKQNINSAIGLDMANDLAALLAYEITEQAANAVSAIDSEAAIKPWGVGAAVSIDLASAIKGGVAGATYIGAYLKNIQALSSILSPNLKTLGGEENTTLRELGVGLGGLQQARTGETTNQATYIGRTDDSAIGKMANQVTAEKTSEILQKDFDKEEERMKKTQKAMEDIGDNVEFIVQLLNVNGIKIRSYPTAKGETGSGLAVSKDLSKNFYSSGGY